ncbi:uncharacterized protein LOC143030378 [Oratosquilla oratoria]|uniref:uncharacterized protein LOC143030378 n=1 Tax=Oratosquilla oratoria TaxID=337810 RepID=UPI003F76879C
MTFTREIEALGALVHPNIVRLLDVFADERRGMTIITEQLVEAVAFIHERHFVHFDLKSENIVLDASRKVLKIIDFGLAVERSNVYERSIRGVQGTFWYMTPEVLDRSQHPCAGGKADVWSLGCVLFEMIKGFLSYSVCGVGYLGVKRRMRRNVWRPLRSRPGALETCLCGEETFEDSQKRDLARISWAMLDPQEETRADIWQVWRQTIWSPEQNGERLKTFQE